MPVNIYLISSKNLGISYVGSTSLAVNHRLALHKYAHKRFFAGRSNQYYTSFRVLADPFATIICLEVCTTEERKAREKFWIQNILTNINHNIPVLSYDNYHKEYVSKMVNCDNCNIDILRGSLYTHRKSKKCAKTLFMELAQELPNNY